MSQIAPLGVVELTACHRDDTAKRPLPQQQQNEAPDIYYVIPSHILKHSLDQPTSTVARALYSNGSAQIINRQAGLWPRKFD